MMDRIEFTKKFSERLNSLSQNANKTSARSKGIDIRELARVTDVSYQMARKYALGLALPEYQVIPKIAKWLNTSPGWLLFGEQTPAEKQKSSSKIEIEAELLKYILQKCLILFPDMDNADKIMQYIAGVIYDASHMNADNKTLFQIVDMMLSSTIQLYNCVNKKVNIA